MKGSILFLSFLIFFSCSNPSEDSTKSTEEQPKQQSAITWDSGSQIVNDAISNGGSELDYPVIQGSLGDDVDIPLRIGFKSVSTVEVYSLSIYNPAVSIISGSSCFNVTYQRLETDPDSYCDFILRASNIPDSAQQYQVRLLVKENGVFRSKFFTFYTSTNASSVSGGAIKVSGITSSDPDILDYGTVSSSQTKTISIKDIDSSDGSILSFDYSNLSSFEVVYNSCSVTSRKKCILRLKSPYPNPIGRDSEDYSESLYVNNTKIDLIAHYELLEEIPPTDSEQTQVQNNVVTFEEVNNIQTTTLIVVNNSEYPWENLEVRNVPSDLDKIYDSCDGRTLNPNKKCIIRLSFDNSKYTGDNLVGSFVVESIPYHLSIVSIQKGTYTPPTGTVNITHLDNIDLSTLTSVELVELTSSNESSFNVQGTCTDDSNDIDLMIGATKIETASCSLGLFNQNIDLSSLEEGQHSLLASYFGGTPDLKYIVKNAAIPEPQNIYFTAIDKSRGNDYYTLWKHDGINPPVVVEQNGDFPNASASGPYPSYNIAFNGKVYMRLNDGSGSGYSLWSYSESQGFVKEINIRANGSSPANFKVINNKLYFSARSDSHGNEPWVYDGVNPPQMLGDIVAGTGGSSPIDFVEFNGKVYFIARNGNGSQGDEIFSYDGTNVVQETNLTPNANSGMYYLIKLKNKLYFRGHDEASGSNKLFVYDGINPPSVIGNQGSFFPLHMMSFENFEGGKLYFDMFSSSGNRGLTRLDDSEQNILRLYDGSLPLFSNIYNFQFYGAATLNKSAIFNGKIYTTCSESSVGTELCSIQNDVPTIIDVNSQASSQPNHFSVFKNRLYFSANDENDGNQELHYIDDNGQIGHYDLNVGDSRVQYIISL